MNSKLALTAVVSLILSIFAIPGSAASSCAYVRDSDGILVRDSAGDCVRTSTWSQDQALEECGAPAKPKPTPVARPAPIPTPPPPPPPPPAPKIVHESISLNADALFDVDSDAIKTEGRGKLDELATHIDHLSDVQSISIIGHTDSTGSESYNQKLSVRRATRVKNYLVDGGIKPHLMSISGMGESKPIASNATSAGRAQNRRVDITLHGTRASQQ